jgi:peptidoglycan/LPS O-acetylase OafA/YrhL
MPSPFLRLFLGQPRTRQQHFDALDGLRGMAVLIVIASHLSLLGLGLVPGLPLGGIGKSGVYLFFVLSAFLLTRVLLERSPAQIADARLWASYALRRILRIWPLYLTVLVLSWGLTRAGFESWHYQLDTEELRRHLALQEGKSVLWSIPVEFKFYLWLPLMALLLSWLAHRRWPLAMQAAIASAIVCAATWFWPPADAAVNDTHLGPYLALFLCGGIAAGVDRALRELAPARGQATWGAIGVLALLAVAATIPEVWARATGTAVNQRLNHHWIPFFGVAWGVLLLAVLHGPRWLRAPFAWAPMRLVGVVSFSAYLWHMPVLFALRAAGIGAWPAAGWWVLAAAMLAAMASFVLVERPWREVRLPADGRIAMLFRGGEKRGIR